ncbi:hypothetical protein DBO85_06765 [Pseudomonas mangrovi]|uniref:Uncharacterized protein n=1 Tax=Pseudomonas mangrovi TaxID=2161748 RepID=A0A2T5PB66_9PSED|nr:hypothetical protein DBO85_06765 [Pseudomonas mangrovi]
MAKYTCNVFITKVKRVQGFNNFLISCHFDNGAIESLVSYMYYCACIIWGLLDGLCKVLSNILGFLVDRLIGYALPFCGVDAVYISYKPAE